MSIDPQPFRDDDPPGGPSDQRDQLLVAYLDGELEEADRMRLEEELISDETLRLRLAELQSGWEMLDLLPAASVTDDFARTTVEMAAASQSRELAAQAARSPWLRIPWGVVLLLATLVAVAVGYALPFVFEQQRFRNQLETLPLAEHLDAYSLDIDLQTVAALATDPDWNEAMRLGQNSGGIVVPEPLDITTLAHREKLQRLEELDNETRSVISRKWDRFEQLDADRRAQIRRRAAEIAEAPQPRVLLRTLDEFAAWWGQLDPGVQTRILQAEGEEQLEAIRDALVESERRWVSDFGSTISGADRELLYELLKILAENRLRAAKQNEVELHSRFGTAEKLVNAWSFTWNWRTRNSEPVANAEIRDWRQLFAPLNDEEFDAVMDVIGPGAKMILLNERSENRRDTLTQWCAAVIRRMSPLANNAEAMQRSYDLYGVDGRNRELLDLRPADEIFERLRRESFGRGNDDSR